MYFILGLIAAIGIPYMIFTSRKKALSRAIKLILSGQEESVVLKQEFEKTRNIITALFSNVISTENTILFGDDTHMLIVSQISKSEILISLVSNMDKVEQLDNERVPTGREKKLDMLSTTNIARKYGFKAKPHLFNFLLENHYIVKTSSYELTEKGIEFGGDYASNEKGERWIVWDENKFFNVIKKFKLHILQQCNISTIDHMTHIKHLNSILKHGLFSHDNPYKKIDISNQEVNSRRARVEPIFQKSIHEYVPFYFNPRNAMLYRNQHLYGDNIVILGFSNEIVCYDKIIFINANAAANHSLFTNDITQLLNHEFIDFSKVFSDSWNNEHDNHLKQTMMSEVLVEKHVEAKYIQVIYCQNDKMVNYIKNNYNVENIQVIAEPRKFF